MSINVNNEGYFLRDTTISEVIVPSILYKYRKAENEFHRNNLRTATVYFSSPAGFEDTEDCNNPIRFDLQSDEELFNKFYGPTKKDYPNRGKEYVVNKTKAKVVQSRKLWALDKTKPSQKQKIDLRLGVLSLTEDPKNVSMWEQYSDYLNGFCIGFDSELMKPVIGGGGMVKYEKSLPLIHRDNPEAIMLDKLTMYKLQQYYYEKEYRVYRMRYDAIHCDERNEKVENGSYLKIIIGEAVQPHIRETIINEAKGVNPNIEVLTASLRNGSIEIF